MLCRCLSLFVIIIYPLIVCIALSISSLLSNDRLTGTSLKELVSSSYFNFFLYNKTKKKNETKRKRKYVEMYTKPGP